jgi:pilus assembly protein CpaC
MFILKILFLIQSNFIWASDKVILNEGDLWKIKSPGSIWVENGEILKYQNFSLLALKPGTSDVRIGKKQFYFQVISRNQNRTYELLKPIINKSIGLKISKNNGIVIIDGKLLRFADWEKLSETCEFEQCRYEMRAQISDDLKSLIKSKFKTILKEHSLPNIKIEFNKRIQLHVSNRFNQFEKLQQLIQKFGISIVKDSTTLDLDPLIKVQITVAEIKRDESMKLGINWPDTYSAQVLPRTKDPLNPLVMSAVALDRNGIGKVLASPNILCRSGKEAKFEAGGEFPIKIISSRVQDVVWKKYGIILKVKPLADHSGRMRISLETEVSSIDMDKAVDGIPALFTNRVNSHFDLTETKTIALSGLIKNESSETTQGLPGLSRIPILGSLFSSKDFRENKSELVIFVRPEIVPEDI